MKRYLLSISMLAAIVVGAGLYDLTMPLYSAQVQAPAAERGSPSITFSPKVQTIVPRPPANPGAPEAPAEAPLENPRPAERPDPPAALPERENLYLANYFPWFEPGDFDEGITAHQPMEPYHNEDEAVLLRHIEEAQSAGIDGFVTIYLYAKDRPDRNIQRLLALSLGRDFRIGVSFLPNALPGATQETLAGDLRYILGTYGSHPNYLRRDGKPVIVFNNLEQAPTAGGEPCVGRNQCLEAWRQIRQQVEEHYPAFWIAEGLDFSYLEVFDGHYLIKTTHRNFPDDYVKLPSWGTQVRAAASVAGQPKLWMATVMPGWDDTLTDGGIFDLREPAPTFRRDREDGLFFAHNWQAAIASDPDWVLLNSYNEWTEGSQIEPSPSYGTHFLELSREWSDRWRGVIP